MQAVTLAKRVRLFQQSRPEAAAFRDTPEGDYLLYVIETYENAMNDDWLPYEIIGLPLERAREFIRQVEIELESGPTPHLIPNLREVYSTLLTKPTRHV